MGPQTPARRRQRIEGAAPRATGLALLLLLDLAGSRPQPAWSAPAAPGSRAAPAHPAISDLVVHGGVVALERVQQVVWTPVVETKPATHSVGEQPGPVAGEVQSDAEPGSGENA